MKRIINKQKILIRWPWLILAILAILLISGCTSKSPTNITGPTVPNPVETTAISTVPEQTSNISNTGAIPTNTSILTTSVTIKDFAFSPTLIHVTEGQTVTWTNNDNVPHTVTSITGEFDSGQIKSRDKFSYTFNKTGEFEYSCKNHPSMTHGVVVVIPK